MDPTVWELWKYCEHCGKLDETPLLFSFNNEHHNAKCKNAAKAVENLKNQ